MDRIPKFLAPLSAAALLASVLLVGGAAPASAAGYFHSHVIRNSCTTTGGKNGYGLVIFVVRGEENGQTGTNYMRARSSVQEWNGSRWVTKASLAWDQSGTYPDSTTTFYMDFGARFDVFKAVRYDLHRLKTTVQFWDQRSGPDRLVKSLSRVSDSC
jgi:hypothetical protein